LTVNAAITSAAATEMNTAPAESVAKRKGEQGGQRPGPRATDHLPAGDEATANVLWCIFACVSETQRLLRAEANTGN
jgi:hypothetical protein